MPIRKLTPIQVLERQLTRLEKRMEALQRVNLTAFRWSLLNWKWSKTICVGLSVTGRVIVLTPSNTRG
jgi:hypothetical protein